MPVARRRDIKSSDLTNSVSLKTLKTENEGLIRPFLKKGVHDGVGHDFLFTRRKVPEEHFSLSKWRQIVNVTLIRRSVGGVSPLI